MALLTNRSPRETFEMLRDWSVPDAYAAMSKARATPGEFVPVTSPRPGMGIHVRYSVPVHFWDTVGHYTLDLCTDHDDDSGCCDTCGRWAQRDSLPSDTTNITGTSF